MKKFVFSVIFLSFGLSGLAQQNTDLSDNTYNLLQTKDVFFNRKLINPINLTDSNQIFIDFFYHTATVGDIDLNESFFISGETNIPAINSSIGFNIDFTEYGSFLHHNFIASFKHSWDIGNYSKFNIGFNSGLWRYQAKEVYYPSNPLIDVYFEPTNSPILDIGVSYQYKKHKFGLSYINIIDSKFKLSESDYVLRENGFILNYQTKFGLTNRITLIPEILSCFNSTETYGIFTMQIDYSNTIQGQILYNTLDSYGFKFSGIFWKFIKVGYYFNYMHEGFDKIDQNYHGINVGIILK
ncbi:MAG: type IX secretion system membrane protein PorP/SprF [Bacteroidales bacterium]|nr:type IX secretion system membrane protein PorP/SprF [Bacteroidales bacterium]